MKTLVQEGPVRGELSFRLNPTLLESPERGSSRSGGGASKWLYNSRTLSPHSEINLAAPEERTCAANLAR